MAATEETLRAAAEDGLSVVRVWALGEYPEDAPDWTRDYAFRRGPEGFVATSYAHLDRVLEAARALGLRVIVVLGNRWSDYGGIPAYLRWSGYATPDGNLAPVALGAFYACDTCEAHYRAHVRRVVTAHRDDPTVFTLSLHGAKNFPFRKEPSDLDVELPDGCADDDYLHALELALDELDRRFEPELVLYLAGVTCAAYLLVSILTAASHQLITQRSWGIIAVRAGGSWIAAIGFLYLAFTLFVTGAAGS